MRIRRLFLVLGCALFALLSACTDIPEQRAHVEVRAAEQTVPTTVDRVAVRKVHNQILMDAVITLNAVKTLNDASRKNAVAVNDQVRAAQGVSPRPPATAPPLTINAGNGCWDIVARYFADDLDWARRVVNRESGCNPGAVNWREGCDTSGRTNSHAMGVFQMCSPMHEATFAAVGCSGRYLDAECNIRAARHLYDASGRAPWGG